MAAAFVPSGPLGQGSRRVMLIFAALRPPAAQLWTPSLHRAAALLDVRVERVITSWGKTKLNKTQKDGRGHILSIRNTRFKNSFKFVNFKNFFLIR